MEKLARWKEENHRQTSQYSSARIVKRSNYGDLYISFHVAKVTESHVV